MQKIYLAGPIEGCSFEECTSWRDEFTKLMPDTVQCLSPMREKTYVHHEENNADCLVDQLMSSNRGIMVRDYYDCHRSDLIVANFIGATRVSIGTVMELAWAWHSKIPTIVIIDDDNLHNHCMLDECMSYRVQNLEQAAKAALLTLWPSDLHSADLDAAGKTQRLPGSQKTPN